MKAIVDPMVWLWFGLVIGGSLCWLRGRKRLGWVLLGLALAASAAEVLNVPARLLASLEVPYLSDTSSTVEPADVVLVLGGYGQAFSQCPPGIQLNEAGNRLLRGIDLLRNGQGGVLLLSGGGSGNPPAPLEAQAAKGWIDSWSILSKPIEILGPCANTHQEALRMGNLAQTKGWNKIILVTSAWHMRRAAAVFRKGGVEVLSIGCDFRGTSALQNKRRLSFIPGSESLLFSKLWLEETFAYHYYRLRGWI